MTLVTNGNEKTAHLLLLSEVRLSFYVEKEVSKLFILAAVP